MARPGCRGCEALGRAGAQACMALFSCSFTHQQANILPQRGTWHCKEVCDAQVDQARGQQSAEGHEVGGGLRGAGQQLGCAGGTTSYNGRPSAARHCVHTRASSHLSPHPEQPTCPGYGGRLQAAQLSGGARWRMCAAGFRCAPVAAPPPPHGRSAAAQSAR